MSRREIFRFWLASLPVFLVLLYFPYIDFPIRVVTWVLALLILIGSIFLTWKFPLWRWSLIAIYGIVILFLLMPSHSQVDRAALRSDYCSALKSYSGCRYVWGGEGYLGVDCSGLVQKGLVNALIVRGLWTLNSELVREGIWLYWHRTTAKVLGEGDHGNTYTVTTCQSLNALDYTLLIPGDLAVTSSGTHVLAYLGNQSWIAADPGAGKVTTFVIPERTNVYFFTPMQIVRWRILN